MARVAVRLSAPAEVWAELERLSRSRSGEVRLAGRARMILACLRGQRNEEIARALSVRPNTVGLWRRRFARDGIAGLRDAPPPRQASPVWGGLARPGLGADRDAAAGRPGQLGRGFIGARAGRVG